MLDNPSAAEVLRACAVDLDELRTALANFINETRPGCRRTARATPRPPRDSSA